MAGRGVTIGAVERTVQLRDGSAIAVRPIEPEDREALARGFERLGPESRYRRFHSPIDRLTEAQLDYLTVVDHVDHEALAAFHEGEIVGVARYVRTEPGPRAEVAVTVGDDWQGRGVGRALLDLLTSRAREEGVQTFTAQVLGTNLPMVELLSSLGEVRASPYEHGRRDLEIALEGDSLPTLLRHAATGMLSFLARLRPDPEGLPRSLRKEGRPRRRE